MVSLTQTLLSAFGSKVLSPRTGILLNNGIMWFDPRPGGPNAIAPGKRPLSNMCPVIATRNGVPWLALGASGGRRIMPAVLQIASMLIDGGSTSSARSTCRASTSAAARRSSPTGAWRRTSWRRSRRALRSQEAEAMVWPKLFACPSAILREPRRGEVQGMTDPMQPVAGAAAA